MRKDYLAVIGFYVLVSIVTIVFRQPFSVEAGISLAARIIPFLIFLILGIFVIRNNKIAIWIFGIMSLLGGIQLLISLLITSPQFLGQTIFNCALALFSGVYVLATRKREIGTQNAS